MNSFCRTKKRDAAEPFGRPRGCLPRYAPRRSLCLLGCYGKWAKLRKEIEMEHHIIKGEKLPSLGLGTWRLTGDECTRAVERALVLGYRHIDTAQIYGNE